MCRVAKLVQLHDQGLLITESSRITITYNLRNRSQTLLLPMIPVDVDFWVKALFVAQGVLKILSTLSVRDESVGDGCDFTQVGGAHQGRPLIHQFLSLLLQCVWAVV